jgi:pimeloyl-ACP methyl ester carboxylesterase
MIENMYFAEELESISSIYIPTSFGEVHALTAGKIGQPLILVVHGSGPRNSSDQYRFLLHEYLVRISYLEKFYIIAIDCPGYGKSKGSMITIKTFPLQLFKEILGELGYKTYFAMFGHSQGGAAIFNSVYDDPSIT